MTSPLIQRLLDDNHATEVDESTLPGFLNQHTHTVLFFAGDTRRYPESNDLAVILPELAKAFTDQFQIGLVASNAGTALQQQYGFSHWPSLVVMRGDAYLGVISKLQDWTTYRSELHKILQSEPRALPGKTIPLLNNSCA